MSFSVNVFCGRTYDFTVPLYAADGTTPLVLAVNDIVRVKIGRKGDALLDLSSLAATTNGSRVTVTTLSPASCNVRLAQADTDALDGAYDMEVSVVDANDTNPAHPIKSADVGVLHVIGGPMDGSIGLT